MHIFYFFQPYQIDDNQEGVLIKDPIGSNNKVIEDCASGIIFKSWATDIYIFDLNPITHNEEYDDCITKDSQKLNVNIKIKIQIKKGNAKYIYEKFGLNWYENEISVILANLIRNEIIDRNKENLNQKEFKHISDNTKIKMEEIMKMKKLPVLIQSIIVNKC